MTRRAMYATVGSISIAGIVALISLAFTVYHWVHPNTPNETPYVQLDGQYTGRHGGTLYIEPKTNGKTVKWVLPNELQDQIIKGYGNTLAINAHSDGIWRVYAYTALGDVPSDIAATTVIVQATPDPTPPGPTPPTPPGPTPPTPPGPTPPTPPGPTPPIPVKGLHVLITYDPDKLQSLPKEQIQVLTSTNLRTYLNSKCAAGPDGKTKEWRVLDKNADLSKESKVWQDLMKLPRASEPWLIVANSKTGFTGPLPVNENDTMATIKKYEE